MKTSSNIEPENIFVDYGSLKNGIITIYVHWDITKVIKVDMNDNEYESWEYCEAVIPWVLPSPMTSKDEIQDYFDYNYDAGENILNWAKASKIQLVT